MATSSETTTALDRDVDEDLALIKNTSVWKEYKRCLLHLSTTSRSDLVVARVEDGSLENIDDLLDGSLKERHSEWRELFVDSRSELCYFQYSFTRDTCYVTERRIYPRDLPEARDSSGKFVRTVFLGAHLMEKIDDSNTGFQYIYLQYADPDGSIPKFLANRPQCDIVLKEIEGIRRVVKNPIHRKKFG